MIREAKQKETEAELARKVKALQPLGDDDEQEEGTEAPPEPGLEPPVPQPTKATETEETTAARNKRYELEQRRKDKAAREAERAKAAEPPVDKELPKVKSPARAQNKSPGQAKNKSPSRAKAKSPGRAKTDKEQPNKSKPDTSKPKGKSPGRAKAKEKTGDDDATDRGVADNTQDNKNKSKKTVNNATSQSVAAKASKHVDDNEYELNLKTGKFVKKKKQKPVVHDDDDDIEMEEIDDEDKDEDYDLDKDVD